MFPAGRPGIALLLMRLSLSLVLTQSVVVRMSVLAPSWTQLLPYSLAAAVTLGIATPLVSGLSVVIQIVTCVLINRPYEWIQACTILNAIALVLLGPGAYSLDSRLFGRRRIDLAYEKEQDGA